MDIEKLRKENEIAKERITSGNAIDDHDTDWAPEEAFVHFEAMIPLLEKLPFPVKTYIDTYIGSIEIICGNINPKVIEAIFGHDNRLRGFVSFSLDKEGARLLGKNIEWQEFPYVEYSDMQLVDILKNAIEKNITTIVE